MISVRRLICRIGLHALRPYSAKGIHRYYQCIYCGYRVDTTKWAMAQDESTWPHERELRRER